MIQLMLQRSPALIYSGFFLLIIITGSAPLKTTQMLTSERREQQIISDAGAEEVRPTELAPTHHSFHFKVHISSFGL